MSTFWIVFTIVLSLAFFTVLFYYSVNLIFYNISLSKKGLTRKIIEFHMKRHYQDYKIDYEWFDKINIQVFSQKGRDGTNLIANFIQGQEEDKLAIVCHGYGAEFKEMSMYAKYFYNRGYNVLLPEMRAHGHSGGTRIGMGWPDRLDLKKWIMFMVKRNPNYKIVLFGVSMGASTVCMTVGEELPSNVICAVSDCAYDNVYDQFEYVSRRMKLVSPKIVMRMYNGFLKKTLKIDLLHFDAIRQVKKAKIPMLFIHGEKDEFVPYENLQRLYDAHPSKTRKYKYTAQGAKHAMSYPSNTEEYEKQLNEFIKNEFK